MSNLLECKNCKTYIGKIDPMSRDPELFLYCSSECRTEREQKMLERRLGQLNSPINLMAAAALKYVPKTPVDENTGKPVKINKTTGKPRKKRVEKGPRKCGKCGGSGHNARTCSGR